MICQLHTQKYFTTRHVFVSHSSPRMQQAYHVGDDLWQRILWTWTHSCQWSGPPLSVWRGRREDSGCSTLLHWPSPSWSAVSVAQPTNGHRWQQTAKLPLSWSMLSRVVSEWLRQTVHIYIFVTCVLCCCYQDTGSPRMHFFHSMYFVHYNSCDKILPAK